MSRSERERALLRRLLAVAVHKLGGEMKVAPEELSEHWELGLDSMTLPTVVTSFKSHRKS